MEYPRGAAGSANGSGHRIVKVIHDHGPIDTPHLAIMWRTPAEPTQYSSWSILRKVFFSGELILAGCVSLRNHSSHCDSRAYIIDCRRIEAMFKFVSSVGSAPLRLLRSSTYEGRISPMCSALKLSVPSIYAAILSADFTSYGVETHLLEDILLCHIHHEWRLTQPLTLLLASSHPAYAHYMRPLVLFLFPVPRQGGRFTRFVYDMCYVFRQSAQYLTSQFDRSRLKGSLHIPFRQEL